MKPLRFFVLGGTMAYRALFNWTTPALFVGTLLGAPLVQMLFFVFLGRQLGLADDEFYVIGNAVLAASIACVYGGAMAVANERRYGTLGAVLLSPRSRNLLWLGRALPYIANGLLVTGVNLAAGDLLLGLHLSLAAVVRMLPLLLTATVGCSAFGLLLGAVGLRLRDVFLIANVMFVLMLLLSGANVPRASLPGWMRIAGDLLPLTHAITGLRAALAGGASLSSSVGSSLAAEAAVGGCYLLAAVFLLHWFERSSRLRATLDVL
ncbi:ABC transporter permease [Streptacidiphilus pinicola]|uniref:Transport permease protein n=1 Tax=Streptacidiphilus pinicola TaxID=2219663 RepID=A0A2X0IG90_9ACTN|nr:ABC transporter permease [Streptacidiphilus pinicola]RAG84054.1 ABC transporter permease [Streptacidiphilus pinicola]